MKKEIETLIHPTAILEKGAELGVGVKIGAYAVIGPHVRIGDQTNVGAHAVIEGRTTIGEHNQIFHFTSIGSKPQDLKYKNEDTELVIANRNLIREYCNISIGTTTGTGKTIIGSDNLFMVYTHIAHDCIVGNHVIVANGGAIAGHVSIDDYAVLGGLTAIHQFARIGKMAMCAGGSMIAQDVPPYCMVHGDRASINGLNVVGLRRVGISQTDFAALKDMYRLVFSEKLTVEDALAKIEVEIPESVYKTEFMRFIRSSERGLCR